MTTVKIRRKGTITIPAKLRKEYKLEEGQTLTVIDLGEGTILLTPKVSQVDKLANQIAEKFKDEGITLEDLLQALNELRKTYNRS
ncbi:MAG: AbrB/MazE/SpoVT family DNA-binding domain-containing protein [Anaerolineales bacterium]|nr:AbrB/MazE/SpoVT family DNA-binding domain-containing protein [Anaerolineales bacterium]